MDRISTDGRTFEAFCTDPELWLDGSYLDHFVIMVNGVRLEDHTGEIRASDLITIYGGVDRFQILNRDHIDQVAGLDSLENDLPP